MKQHQGYEINFEKNTIIVTKSFLKEAGIVGSAAYSELACVRKDFPDYQIEQRTIAKKKGKQSYGELTYKTMAEHIEAKEEENAPIVLAQFERIKKLSKHFVDCFGDCGRPIESAILESKPGKAKAQRWKS